MPILSGNYFYWSSSNENVATVDENGLVTAIAEGESEISFTTKDGIERSYNVIVKSANTNIELVVTPSEIEMTPGTKSIGITCLIDGQEVITPEITWDSSDWSIARVRNETLYGSLNGEATITARVADAAATIKVSVYENVLQLELPEQNRAINIGDEYNIKYKLYPTTGTKGIFWKSSNPKVATVDSEGKVIGLSEGNVTIYMYDALAGSELDRLELKVVKTGNNIVTEVDINQENYTFTNLGDRFTLSATVKPDNAKKKDLLWKSSDTNIATVNNKGEVTAVANGNCTITASARDGSNAQDKCEITVNANIPHVSVPVKSITLDKPGYSFYTGGPTSIRFIPTISPSNATIKEVTWVSTNPYVAVVDENGVVTPVGIGTTMIYAIAQDGSGVISTPSQINVSKQIEYIDLDITEYTITSLEQILRINVLIYPEDAPYSEITCDYDGQGFYIMQEGTTIQVTPLDEGTGTITVKVTCNGEVFQKTCKITVDFSRKILTEKINLMPSEHILNHKGETVELTPKIEPIDVSNKELSWVSDNPNIATVDQNGKVTAVANGTCTITASAKDGSNVNATSNIIVQNLPESSIKVDKIMLNHSSEVRLTEAGETIQLVATISPVDATNKSVEWTSNNKDVATVDENGLVTAVGNGTAIITITAKDGSGIKETCSVRVILPTKVTKIILDKEAVTLTRKGATTYITADARPLEATNRFIKWSSSNDKVATVDQNGKVTAVADGTAEIIATAQDGSGVNAKCIVTVDIQYTDTTFVKVSRITLNKETVTLTSRGATTTLTATVIPDNATIKSVKWTSSNNEIATVDQNGKVTAIENGTATITATAEDESEVKATCTVTVDIQPEAIKVTKITLNKGSTTLTSKGSTTTLTATVTPTNATNKGITWTSSNDKVATVDANGKVTAVGNGTATITVTAQDGSNVKATCTVTVNIPIKVTKITLNKTTATLTSEGATTTLTATVTPTNATNKGINWISSNDKVATVDANGKVTAIENGTATITATAQDGSNVKAACTVTVNIVPTIIKVTNITLNKTAVTLTSKGSTTTLTATVTPTNATNKGINWISSNDKVATVDANGAVTAIENGTATITATSEDGSNVKVTCTITVNIKESTPVPEEYKLGDINGDGKINARDAKLVMQHFTKKITLTEEQQKRADVSGDGKINARDAKLIMQYFTKKIDKFPAEE